MSKSWAEHTLFRVLHAIPGYTGYRDKETRRDADRAVRDRLAAELASRAERIERIAGQLADQRRIAEVGPVNAFAGAVRHLGDRINTATYGYGGLFSNRDINADVLDQLRLFDESLFAGVDQIDGAVTELEQTIARDGGILAAASAGQRVVDEVTGRLDLRNRVVETATAATPEQMGGVLAVLQSPEELKAAASPPAAYDLQDRDAIAVLGDNYVVDARIDIESAAGFFRIFRIDVAPDKWLLVPKTRGQSLAVLSNTSDPYTGGVQPTVGVDGYVVETTGHGSGDVAGAGGQSGRRPVAYTLLRGASVPSKRAVVLTWESDQQVMVGAEVHPDDIEIFGKPA